ncbi:RNA-directed DNA polymerase from mobile element jockey [Eumeta japonica]|uniref:RNA-directed DNA polymerase from mobile element jockey n=1 Tax=Eumeta variegata TaxID=151549 RepID=A0A4C1S8X8_EUMVA|nr:RNA-directed DNA polymerase from mobile element jockey [Eumeta japonica]
MEYFGPNTFQESRRQTASLPFRIQASNPVWHPGLLYKLIVNTEISPVLVRTVALLLECCSFYVAVEDASSDSRSIHAGAPQGSCLSPNPYATFMGNILTIAGQLQDWKIMLALNLCHNAYLASSRRADLAIVKLQGSRPTTRLAGQMASRHQCDEDGHLSDLPAAYHTTEAETPKTGRKRIQMQQDIALQMIVRVGLYVLNNVIARELRIETVEEFIQHLARQMYDIADQGPYEFLRNIALIHERSPGGRLLSREHLK